VDPGSALPEIVCRALLVASYGREKLGGGGGSVSVLSTGILDDFRSPKKIAILTNIGIPKNTASARSTIVPKMSSTAFREFRLSSNRLNLLMLKL